MPKTPGNKIGREKEKRPNPVEELGKKFGFGRSTTYAYLKQGNLPGVKIGHKWVVPDLDEVEKRIKAKAWENWRPPRTKSSDSEEQ
jgi:hypothetical protein